ncbi:MAG: T9SS type A sorting domain-containing protein [Chitinophagaceae bacterium]|nr:T9SS type A sorting domain-containing protein [Chitinophagaceae bacterium]
MKKILLLISCIICSAFAKAQIYSFNNPEIVPLELIRLSPALRDLPTTKHLISFDEIRVEHENPSLERFMETVNPNARPVGADPIRQMDDNTRDSSDTEITMLSNWEGMSANIDPSDNCIAVGPNHVMQMVNNNISTFIRIWDKTGNILIDELEVKDFSGINDCGDPNLVYDEQADRYVLLVLGSCSSSKLEICVSQTNDPTGEWYVYTFTTSGGFPDYPKLSTWGDSYFITTNSNSPTIWAVDRASVLDGLPIGTVQKFTLAGFPSIGFEAASPVNFTGTTLPPEGSPALMIRVADDAWGGTIDSDHLEIFEVNIDWTLPANSTISGPYNLATSDYNSEMCGFNSLNCIPQPGTTLKLDPLANIVMDKVMYRNFENYESIVCTHGVNADGEETAGVRWYELRKTTGGTWHVFQEGTYSPDTENRWMSSISINDDGAIALGYNISSETVFPGTMVIGRAKCDDLNLMTTAETVGVEGSNHNSSNRYGDYNGMVTDPVDGSFWFTATYNPTTSWSTNVSHFTISSCLATSVQTIQSSVRDVTMFPMPVTDDLIITLHSDKAITFPLQMMDAMGRVVLSQNLQLVNGENKLHIDVHMISNGIYFTRMQTADFSFANKVVIER